MDETILEEAAAWTVSGLHKVSTDTSRSPREKLGSE
jgi:hypothetical protein